MRTWMIWSAAIVGIFLGAGIGLPGGVATAQGIGGDNLTLRACLDPTPDPADLAFYRAECDMEAAEKGYRAGVLRPLTRPDGAIKNNPCTEEQRIWLCEGVPSADSGPPSP